MSVLLPSSNYYLILKKVIERDRDQKQRRKHILTNNDLALMGTKIQKHRDSQRHTIIIIKQHTQNKKLNHILEQWLREEIYTWKVWAGSSHPWRRAMTKNWPLQNSKRSTLASKKRKPPLNQTRMQILTRFWEQVSPFQTTEKSKL